MSSYREIAAAMGVSHSTVWRALRSTVTKETVEQLGKIRYDSGLDGKRRPVRWLTVDEQEARARTILALRDEGYSVRRIADAMCWSVGTVHNVIRTWRCA